MPSPRHCVSYIWRFRSLSLLIHCGRSRAPSLITGSGIEKRLWSSKVRLHVSVGVREGESVKSVRGLTVSWAGALNCLFYHKRTLLSMLVRRFSWNAPPDMPSTRIKKSRLVLAVQWKNCCHACGGRWAKSARVWQCGSARVSVRVRVWEWEIGVGVWAWKFIGVWEYKRGGLLEIIWYDIWDEIICCDMLWYDMACYDDMLCCDMTRIGMMW